MYDKRAEKRAALCGILPRLQALENELLKIDGISDIGFDIDDYRDWPVSQIILVPRYHLDVERPDYFDARKNQLQQILSVCEAYDLYTSGDHIEDQGAHWYIVRRCGRSWPRFKADCVTRLWLERHIDDDLQDVSSMTPAQLADACTYCQDVDNPFSRELATRAGNIREFTWATCDEQKTTVLRACAAQYGVTLI